MRICEVPWCDNKHEAKGYCKKHYDSVVKYGFISLPGKNYIEKHAKFAKIYIKNNRFAVISINDVDKVKDYRWHFDSAGYAATTVGDKLIRLHKHILELKTNDGLGVYHLNGNRLDCRRFNLQQGKVGSIRGTLHKVRADNKVGYCGVYKSNKKFAARISKNFKSVHLGVFDTPELAAEAYNKAATELHGKLAFSNKIKNICMEEGCDEYAFSRHYCRHHYNQMYVHGHTFSFDIIGNKYGKLTVIEKTDKRNEYNRTLFRCKCECGGEKLTTRWLLVSGSVSMSCETCAHRRQTHGESTKISRAYRAWLSMKQASRSTGAVICDRWLTFVDWKEDNCPKPDRECCFMRTDKAKGYEPGNVYWSSGKYMNMNRGEKMETVPNCKAHGKRECEVEDCEQRVYGDGGLCYFHQKVVDDLLSAPSTYTECINGPELILKRALTNPSDFSPLNIVSIWRM